ncbi:hypothetical protein BGZ99_009488 [Dissophora globulifera]|uniref:Uncharacterized protein n=1 Tax=Dissophora globulifera TaxID=979702 RepID=A0A9P6UM51_9FUNG|nr:hypothetical protein BGZ99_009488 [Dissophora globulifera]
MSKSLLHKYGHLIRRLTIRDPTLLLDDWFTAPYCCNLVELHLSPSLASRRHILASARDSSVSIYQFEQDMNFLNVASVDKAIDLISANPNLRHLSEKWHMLAPGHAKAFMNRLCYVRTPLERIHTAFWQISSINDLTSLLRCSSQLQQLSLFHSWINLVGAAPHTSDTDTSSQPMVINLGPLRKLSIVATVVKRSDAVTDLPVTIQGFELSSLTLTGFQGSSLHAREGSNQWSFVRQIAGWQCPKLTTLTISQDEFDAEYSAGAILTTAEGLRKLEISGCAVGSGTIYRLLQRHAVTLESVNLSWSFGLSSSDLQSILTSCPNLRRFEGSSDRLQCADMIKQPWTCLQLQDLVVFLDSPLLAKIPSGHTQTGRPSGEVFVDTSEKAIAEREELYRAIYDQLAPLKQLRRIRLGGFTRDVKVRTGIPWSLEAGLDRLRELSKVESFYITESVHEIGIAEVEWFRKYWPRLREIRRLDDRERIEADPRVLEVLGKIELF